MQQPGYLWWQMPFYLFLWTARLVEHLAENGVSQDEFEEQE
jgi:hypothetical protein